MRRCVAVMIAAFMSASFFAACGGDDAVEDSDARPETPAAGQTTEANVPAGGCPAGEEVQAIVGDERQVADRIAEPFDGPFEDIRCDYSFQEFGSVSIARTSDEAERRDLEAHQQAVLDRSQGRPGFVHEELDIGAFPGTHTLLPDEFDPEKALVKATVDAGDEVCSAEWFVLLETDVARLLATIDQLALFACDL